MNTVWSDYVQGTGTLYLSRKLRFDDRFAGQYRSFFGLDPAGRLRLLEVGCGPGALAGALHRWYPYAEITAVDRDSAFIAFAREHEPGIAFAEGDATVLPFADGTFDVTVSNTVSEHVEPSRFFGEQYRVLKPGGVCLVLSSRKGVCVSADCLQAGERERTFWEKVRQYDRTMEEYSVRRYPMDEAQLPAAMEAYGFRSVSTGYATVALTPDDPAVSASMAHAMINADRQSDLEAIASVRRTMPESVGAEEAEEMEHLINEKYDRRIRDYESGKKHWDTGVSVIQMVRGIR